MTYHHFWAADIVIVSTQFLQNPTFWKRSTSLTVHVLLAELWLTPIFCCVFFSVCKAQTKTVEENAERAWQDLFKDRKDVSSIMRKNYPLFTLFHWRRLILDEGHELFGALSKAKETVMPLLIAIKSSFRWFTTGTPFPDPLLSARGALR